MLDIKRIRTDFDAVAKKLATRGVAAATLNEMKKIDAKRRDILVKVENLKAGATLYLLKSHKLNATRKMQMIRLLRCKPSLQRSKHWIQNWLKSMQN